VAYDVRKAQPYMVYEQMKFDVPVGQNGDNYDRYLCRMEEIVQSLSIIEQALAKIPSGPFKVEDKRISFPSKQEVYGNMEALINHFKLFMEGHGICPPEGEVYQAVEGANGELGFYIVSDGTGKPYRLRCRPPSFCIMSGVKKMIEGRMIADIVPTFGSVNMIGGECDR
jgi:NADH-quinone oxidoreductase subunit D